LQKIFDILINSFIEKKVGIADNFLNTALATSLKDNLIALYDNNQMLSAGTGNVDAISFDKSVRSDKIFWLDRRHNDKSENDFFDLMDEFVSYLNSTCYTGITGYEFHYAMYEKGTFYKKHMDRFRSDSSRLFSMIMYLNEDWEQSDGGELCIHHADHLQNISPNKGKSIFFKSNELLHEVLVTQKPRMSITGWLKCDAAFLK